MTDIGIRRAYINRRNGIRAGNIIQHQALAGNRGFGLLSLIRHHNAAAEGADAAALGNRARIDNARGFRSIMHNLAACVKVLAVTGEGYACKLAACALTV